MYVKCNKFALGNDVDVEHVQNLKGMSYKGCGKMNKIGLGQCFPKNHTCTILFCVMFCPLF
jgi:hypothetical protein